MVTFAITVLCLMVGWFLIICYSLAGPKGLGLGFVLTMVLVIPIVMLIFAPSVRGWIKS